MGERVIMNREILFKAKRIDNGEWVEGYYTKTRLGTDIKPSDVIFVPFKINRNEEWGWIKIDPETLCQYTGLTDKNGKKIWENDILVEKHKGIVTMKYRVVFDLEEGAWMLETKSGARYRIGVVNQRDFEVCGNILTIPELLEVER